MTKQEALDLIAVVRKSIDVLAIEVASRTPESIVVDVIADEAIRALHALKAGHK